MAYYIEQDIDVLDAEYERQHTIGFGYENEEWCDGCDMYVPSSEIADCPPYDGSQHCTECHLLDCS